MRASAALMLVFLSGCRFFQVSGPAGIEATGGGDEAARLKKVYDDFTPDLCPQGAVGCGAAIQRAAGIKERPHGDYDPVRMWNPREGENPDPEWITGWDSLPRSEGYNASVAVFDVIARAALSKAERRKCETDYASTFEALTKADAALDASIDAAIRAETEHDQIRALLALRPRRGAAGDDRPSVGARFRLEQEILQRFAGPRETLLAKLSIVPGDLRDVRPRLSLEDERTFQCAHHTTGSASGGAVRALYTDAEIATIDGRIAAAKTLEAPKREPEEALSLDANWAFKAPFLAVDEAKIGSITRSGKGGTLTYETTREDTYPYGCAATSDRFVVHDGTIQRDTNCNYGTRTTVSTVKIRFTDLPAVDLAKGDTVKLYVRVTDYKSKEISGGVGRERVEQTFVGEGLAVTEVKRAEKSLWKLVP
ncbi:MAG: hypothetical protein U0414_32670 [Polyangiaceae bacterium]